MKNLLFVLTLIFSVARADESLINSPTRPKMEDVIKTHKNYDPKSFNPAANGRFNPAYFRESLRQGAPELIAKLEAAYPGATFVFMGRDTQLLADVVETFYLSIGQKNRVVQLGVSKPTLEGLNPKDILKYLEYFGFKIKDTEKQPAFILVDTVSSGDFINDELVSGRQGRYLLQIVYSQWVKIGKKASSLLKKFNMIALQVSTFAADDETNKSRYSDIKKIDRIQSQNAKNLNNIESADRYGYEMILPIIKDTNLKLNEAGYDHFTGAWHDRYQAPTIKGKTLVPTPGNLMDVNQRRTIIWMQHQIVDMVKDPDFKNRTLKALEKLGGSFSPPRALGIKLRYGQCRGVYSL